MGDCWCEGRQVHKWSQDRTSFSYFAKADTVLLVYLKVAVEERNGTRCINTTLLKFRAAVDVLTRSSNEIEANASKVLELRSR